MSLSSGRLAMASASSSSPEVWFRCARCIKAIADHEPVHMRDGASYCSIDCRTKGCSTLYVHLLNTQFDSFNDWRAHSSSSLSTLSRYDIGGSSCCSSSRQSSEPSAGRERHRVGGLGNKIGGVFGSIFMEAFGMVSKIMSNESIQSLRDNFKPFVHKLDRPGWQRYMSVGSSSEYEYDEPGEATPDATRWTERYSRESSCV